MGRYDDEEEVIVLTPNVKHLMQCESRLRGVQRVIQTAMPNESVTETTKLASAVLEEGRLTAARDDIISRFDDADKEAHGQWLKKNAPREMTDEEKIALTKKLDENRDRASH